VRKPAIVLDIDETSLSNWAQIWQDDFGYVGSGACDMKPDTACGFHAWELMALASAIEPTLALFNLAKQKKVAVFFVTGRRDAPDLRAATESNLTKVGYLGWDRLIMRGANPVCKDNDVTSYKRCERKGLAESGFTIIANVGDQWSDLDSDAADPSKGSYAEKIYKVPNPFYYIP